MHGKEEQQGEEFIKPSGVWWWVAALVMTPVFFAIGMSVHGGWPPQGDLRTWAFLIGLTVYPLTAQAFEVGLWHLRERMNRPLWWTSERQRNVGTAILLACLTAVLWVPEGTVGSALAIRMIGGFLIAVLPFFALCCAVDWLFARIGKMFVGRAKR